jgi:hypothetical protein
MEGSWLAMTLSFRMLVRSPFRLPPLRPLHVVSLLRLLSLGLVAALMCSRAMATPAEGAARVIVRETTHSFGRVERGSVLRRSFLVENAGSLPLTIDSMEFSSPGVRARVAQSIAPGRSANLVVDWDTDNYLRDAEVQVALQLNDPALPKLVLTLSCFVVSPIEVDPVPAFYLSQFVGEPSSQTITLRNNTGRALKVTGTAREGNSFTLAVKPVNPGQTFALTAKARPGLQPGEYQESAWVLTDNSDRPKIRLDVNILVKPDVYASVDVIDMGRVRLSTIEANPGVLDLLQQTVILESRSADLQVMRIESDLPFMTVHREPDHASKRIRLDVGLDRAKLLAGEYTGNLRVYTGLSTQPVVTLPVTMSVAD